MALRNVFKKKEVIISSPISGKLESIEELNDPVFSKKMMGPGFFITTSETGIINITSPVKGIVGKIFETKHALTLRAGTLDLLLHLGIDTVELQGLPFELCVSSGEHVERNQVLIKMNVQEILESKRTAEVIVVFPETFEEKLCLQKQQVVTQGELVGRVM